MRALHAAGQGEDVGAVDFHRCHAALCVHVHPERDAVRVCPVGEVDLATVGAVRDEIDELRAAGFRQVVLDLRGVTFLDSTGLRLCVDLDAAARADGWQLSLIDGPPPVRRAFDITGLRDALPFVELERPCRWTAGRGTGAVAPVSARSPSTPRSG